MAKIVKKAAPKKAAKKAAPAKKTAAKKVTVKKAAAPKKATPAKKVAAPKKAAKKESTSLGRKAPSNRNRKQVAKKAGVKKVVKKVLTEREQALREANSIVNSAPKFTRVEGKAAGKAGKKPTKNRSNNENNALLDAIIDGLQEKKAKNITVLNLTKLPNQVTDYFVIADADSRTHVDAIADSVEDVVEKKTGEKAYHTEGHQVGEWILVDYINIVVHVFQKEIRDFYNIEALWADADVRHIN